MNAALLKDSQPARSNLRLTPHLWLAIDTARGQRAGNISRNTWITEAILEKLAREQQNRPESDGPDARIL
jgi:hypothetical protein